MRLVTVAAICAALVLALPAAAQARIPFDKHVSSAHPSVWVAADDGSHQRRLAGGLFPKISPNGRWVAYQRFPGGRPQLRVVRTRGGKSRLVVRAGRIDDVHWAPDPRHLAAELGRGLLVYDVHAKHGVNVRGKPLSGFSFSPDSRTVVYGHRVRDDLDAASDLFVVSRGGTGRHRLTTGRRSLNPLWTAQGIVFDQQTIRPQDAPVYTLFTIRPDGGGLRQLAGIPVPSLASGPVPHSASADGAHLLVAFSEQDEEETYVVDVAGGAARKVGTFYVPGGISRDGSTIVAQTGGPDPGSRHSFVAVAFGGGPRRLLLRGGADPDWTG
jgi:hypothetical protein